MGVESVAEDAKSTGGDDDERSMSKTSGGTEERGDDRQKERCSEGTDHHWGQLQNPRG